MKYGSIYLLVRDFDKSLDFYEKILEMKVSATNGKNLTPIRYLNVFSPYWYFTFMDPDGNPIKITGAHEE